MKEYDPRGLSDGTKRTLAQLLIYGVIGSAVAVSIEPGAQAIGFQSIFTNLKIPVVFVVAFVALTNMYLLLLAYLGVRADLPTFMDQAKQITALINDVAQHFEELGSEVARLSGYLADPKVVGDLNGGTRERVQKIETMLKHFEGCGTEFRKNTWRAATYKRLVIVAQIAIPVLVSIHALIGLYAYPTYHLESEKSPIEVSETAMDIKQ